MGALYEDVEKFFGDIFAHYGRFLARYPVVFIVISLGISSLLGLGLFNVKYENDVETLYTPMGSPAFKNRAELTELFPDTTKDSYYPHQLIYHGTYGELLFLPKNGDNILKPSYISEIRDLHDRVLEITLEEDDGGLHYVDLCAARAEKCVIDGDIILEAFNQSSCFNSSQALTIESDNRESFLDLREVLSGIKQTDEQSEVSCLTAKMMKLRFNLKHDTDQQKTLSLQWELKFLDLLSKYHSEDMEIIYAASESLDIELADHLGQDTKFFSLTIMIMVLYAVFVSSGGNWVSTRVLLALAGILAALLAILASFGLLSLCGMMFVDICGVMPFLILGVGVDDMFILMSGWRQTDLSLSVEDRVAETFRSSAISVTITSLTNMLAFCIGATSPFLSVKNFCIFASVAVLFCYVNNMTFFSGCMVLHAQRVLSHRHCVTCLPTKSRKSLTEDGHSRHRIFCCHGHAPKILGEDDSLFEKIPNTVLPRILLQWQTKIIVILLFIVYLGVSIWGASNIKIGLKMENVVPDSSYLSTYSQMERKYFKNHGPPIMFVINDPVRYEDTMIRQKIHKMLSDARGSGYIDDNFELSWLNQYFQSDYKPSNNRLVSDLRDNFLMEYPEYTNDIKFNDAKDEIIASRFYVRSKLLNDSTSEGNMMIKIRSIIRNSSLPILAYCPQFIYYEHYVSILKNTLLSVGVAVIGMIFIALMFIPHPISITCVTITMVTIVLGMFGFMSFWDLELSAITNVQIILSVGFCVDYTVHISHAFMAATGKNRNERVVAALEKVGIPILNGGFSSILGVLFLAFSQSYIYRSFFKTMVLVISLGIAHSLLLLPVVLSFIGPQRTSRPRMFDPPTSDPDPMLQRSLSMKSIEKKTDPTNLNGKAHAKDNSNMELIAMDTPDEKQGLLTKNPLEIIVEEINPDSDECNHPAKTLLDRTPDDEHYRSPFPSIHYTITPMYSQENKLTCMNVDKDKFEQSN